jgi:hypothetical protein
MMEIIHLLLSLLYDSYKSSFKSLISILGYDWWKKRSKSPVGRTVVGSSDVEVLDGC